MGCVSNSSRPMSGYCDPWPVNMKTTPGTMDLVVRPLRIRGCFSPRWNAVSRSFASWRSAATTAQTIFKVRTSHSCRMADVGQIEIWFFVEKLADIFVRVRVMPFPFERTREATAAEVSYLPPASSERRRPKHAPGPERRKGSREHWSR